MKTQALALVLILSTSAIAAEEGAHDPRAFERLDPAELRAAEARIYQLVERRSGRALRAPNNEAEAYVQARQLRLAERIHAQPRSWHTAEAEVTESFWPAARATRIQIDDQGRVHIQCVGAASLLGPRLPDFRLSNQPTKVER
ncbi:MAG: hypothetical protein JJU31_17145 [Wenzhouxiangella sp.]|nr:hypothetical protein [Wenzhouxiangella sp.]MCH8479589.1 hypothetical protein [Wenzhouxiangella sp.]TVR99470.1 MAG: hypothetical protein EA418_00125 [Wenzhouxiangellaceae bacterium]